MQTAGATAATGQAFRQHAADVLTLPVAHTELGEQPGATSGSGTAVTVTVSPPYGLLPYARILSLFNSASAQVWRASSALPSALPLLHHCRDHPQLRPQSAGTLAGLKRRSLHFQVQLHSLAAAGKRDAQQCLAHGCQQGRAAWQWHLRGRRVGPRCGHKPRAGISRGIPAHTYMVGAVGKLQETCGSILVQHHGESSHAPAALCCRGIPLQRWK